MSINLSAMWPRNNDSFGPQAQQSITSKWRPSQERRSRSNQTAWDGDRQSGSSGNAMAPLVGLPNTNGQTSIDGRLLFGPNGNGVAADLGGTINTMSNRGINVENALKGYSRSTSNPNNAFWSKTETAYDARSYPQSSNNQINNHQSSFQAANISNSFTGNLSETLPVLPQKQPIIQGKNLNLGQKIVNPADYSASFSDEQEILRRERIKEQNLQEKMNIVQKEQKMSSEITLQFKQMSRLLDSCLKLDETCSGIAPIKQNDYQIPQGNQLIQYKSIEFPPAITSFYNEEQERFGDNVSVNKGLIPQLSMAWVSINTKLFMWQYGPLSFSSFQRLKEKNEYYRQNKDRFGSRQDDRVERDAVREFNLEDIILSVSYGQPKNAIFQQNQVKDVLVIAFPTEVKVKHLKFEKSQFQLQDIDVSVSTDHELVNTVVFSKRGRIFYGGSSGRVKQIDYFSQQLLGFTLFQKFKAREGVRWSEKIKSQFQFWTGQQNVVSISVDDTRQILYALVELEPDKNIILSAIQAIKQKPKLKNKHRIDVYDLGAFDEEFELVASLSHQTFAEQLLKHSSINNFRLKEADPELNIVSVSAIEKTASSELFFMITTQSGIRAYYSINTKMACNRKGSPLTTKECKEARDKFSMFERNRPTGEFVLQQVKGMVEIKPQSGSFRSLRVFYDPKNYVGCKSMYIQYDEEQKRQIKSVFALPKGLVFQKVENGQNRLLIIDNNDAYVARLKENMFTNCKIFQDVSAAQIVASERISEISLEFSRDDSSNFISDFTIAQIPEKNLLTQATTRLLQFQSFESLEANQTVSEQSGQQSFLCLNDLSRQSYCAPSHYVVLTSKGILLSYQQRPIDTLYQVIKVLPDYITEPNQSQEQLYQQQALQARMGRLSGQQEEAYLMIQQKQNCFEFFEQFFVTYGITETFAMLTQMLCHSHFEYYQNLNVHNHLDKQMKQKLVSGLDLNNTSNFIAGTQYDVKQQQQQQAGAPNQIQTSGAKNPKLDPSDIPETIITEISEQILWKTHFIFQKYGDILLEDDNDITQSQKQSKKERRLSQQLPNSEFANTLGKAWEWTRHKYTSKIEGILLYFSRLIRPVWNRTLVNGQAFQYVVNEPAGNFHRDETQTFIRRINEFSYWLENETKLIYCKEIKNQNSSNGSIVGLSDTSSQTLSAGTQLFQQQQGYTENGNANIFNNRTSLGGATNQPLQPPRKTKERIELQEVKNAEALLIDDLLLFTKKISQVASLFLFICENKLRQNLNNAVFSEYKVDLLNLKFRDLFGEKRHEKVLKDYVMATIKLDPKYTDQARLILNQFNIIFQERDFSISQAEIKLQAILQKVAQNGMPDKKYLNECTSILLDHIEHLQIEYLNRFYQIYSALDAREDFVRILLDCYKFHHRINENIERQQIELSAMEEQLRMSASYAPVNQYSEQLKITKQLLEDNAVQTNFCLEKLIEIIENLHKESLLQQKNTQSKAYKEAQIQTIISILQHYPFEAVHGAVVESLLRNKRKTEILKLNSPFTEQVLESFGKKRAECQNCQDCFYCLFYLDCLKIKFKYFEQLGNIREAYKVAFEISNFKNNEDINSDMVFLSDRIDFTDIAIYDVSLILSDFNISQEEKQNFIQEKEILQKQLKVLKVQKRIHDKLSLSLSFIEGNLKKIKDTNQKKAIEEQKKNYQECSEVLSIIKLDEGQLEKYIIQNLNLVEFSLILYDLIPENQLPGNPDKLYEQLITRMSSADSFETEPWPLNIQNTLSMLNSEITNKNLFSLQTIILKGENVNAERTWKDQQNIRQFLDLYSGILANREDASARILNSSYWMPHFLITYLNFSPLTLISTYSPIWNIFFSNKEANRQVLKNYIHLTNCLMLLLKHSVSYISNVLLNQSTKSSEIIAVKKSIQAIERILDSFNNEAFTAVREAAGSESEVIQYQQQFERVQQDLLEQISAIQQLGGGDTQSRGGLGNSTNEFASFAGGSTLSGAKNLLFNFEQELPKQQQSSQEQQQYQQQSSLKSNSWNFPSDPDTVLFKQDQQSQNLQRNSSLNSKGNNNALDGFDKSETLKTTKYYQIREQDNEEEEGIVFDKKQRA